ncbi:PEP-CTERM sorting domain-containing protein [Roseateles albus]|uniref:PEP-CTERM sorting domain-containing protein n=1 Tax=Roseateles albus TaxID=2987525 RepID=A0ABT5KCV0_9BURK|nr:PEP-CTERM sorting domain-containing protein [Roseateles albus]MDC8771713.1 PEP-CTERM sorting domain-containing protein [Roseateles albus]
MRNLIMKKSLQMAALLGALTLASAANANGVPGQGSWETTLLARDLDGNLVNGPEAFYDTALNVTWLRAGSASAMNWSTAKAWAEQDRFGLSGWRLPTTHVTTADGSCDYSYFGGTGCGFNPDSSVATGSEMAHLFFQSLGNKSRYIPGTLDDQAGWGLSNTGDFKNLRSYSSWSGTVYAPQSGTAWFFSLGYGSQANFSKDQSFYALAVHPGDVVAVPEPQTWALTLIGLTGLLLSRRRRVA